MATYASIRDFENRWGSNEVKIAADRVKKGPIDTRTYAQVVTQALTDASEEIDSYLNAHYVLPLATIPVVLTRYCCDMAMYLMSQDAGTATDEKKERWKSAIDWLTKLSTGKVTLGLATLQDIAGPQAQLQQSAFSNIQTPLGNQTPGTEARIFTRQTMRGVFR